MSYYRPIRPLQIYLLFLIPLSPRIDAGRWHFWREIVVKTTSSIRPKIEAVYFCTVLNTCGRKLRGDEKQLIDLEWPYRVIHSRLGVVVEVVLPEISCSCSQHSNNMFGHHTWNTIIPAPNHIFRFQHVPYSRLHSVGCTSNSCTEPVC